MAHIYFEDIEADSTRQLGTIQVHREDMLAFAERYDPLPIHVDPEAAAESIHGGLIASGWYTVSHCMRLFATEFLSDTTAMGAFDADISWPNPVRPADTLTVSHGVLDKRPSESRSDRGYVRNLVRAENQHEECVLEWEGTGIFLARTGHASSTGPSSER